MCINEDELRFTVQQLIYYQDLDVSDFFSYFLIILVMDEIIF